MNGRFSWILSRRRVQPMSYLQRYEFRKNKRKNEIKDVYLKLSRSFMFWYSYSKNRVHLETYKAVLLTQNGKKLKLICFHKLLINCYKNYANKCYEYNEILLSELQKLKDYSTMRVLLRLCIKEKECKNLEVKLDDLQSQINCCICFTNKINIVFTPCNHAVCCKECSMRVSKCPICNAEVEFSKKIFL